MNYCLEIAIKIYMNQKMWIQQTTKIQVHGIKMTSRQTIVFLINSEDLEKFKTEVKKTGLSLGVFGNVVRNVKGCAGNDDLCMRALDDAHGLGVNLQTKFMNQPVPKDFKISTAGCVRSCTDPYCADFGVIAIGKDTFSIYLGGRGGSKKLVHLQIFKRSFSTKRKGRGLGTYSMKLIGKDYLKGYIRFISEKDNI